MVSHGDDIYNYDDIRLNFSSNVYGGFDHTGLFKHLTDRMSCIMNYPEPTPYTLEKRISDYLGVEAENIMVTNGATEAIYYIAQAYRGSRSHIVCPTFAEYAEACRMYGHIIVDDGEQADLTWICNPNNPTGEVYPSSFIDQPSTLFVIDESYDRFTDIPLMTAREAIERENVIILHSMTKEYAIPGLRIGYIIACKSVLDNLRQYQRPWSVSALALEAGHYLLVHDDDYRIDVDLLLSEAKRMRRALNELNIEVHPSDSHILLCKLPSCGISIHGVLANTASELKDILANKYGILIRDASNFEGLTPQHFRIAVQTKKKDNALLKALSSK